MPTMTSAGHLTVTAVRFLIISQTSETTAAVLVKPSIRSRGAMKGTGSQVVFAVVATTLASSSLGNGGIVVVNAFNSFFSAPLKSPAATSSSPPPPPSRIKTESWLDVLSYNNDADKSTPSFDVLAKTIEYANCKDYDTILSYYSDDYVFRGPIIGPITGEDVRKTQEGFKITSAYPDLQTRPFGFTIDPDNPYRCYFFERWEGTNTESVQIGPATLPPTNAGVKLPTHIMSIHWTPEGKIKYTCLSSPLDRFEGTSKGAGAVFGLLVGAGLDAGNASVGDALLRLQQRFIHIIGGFGRNWSLEKDIPSWWKSKARGADPNDI